MVKWQTRRLEVAVPQGMQVRLLSRAPFLKRTLSSVGRATRLHRVGRRFESCSVHQAPEKNISAVVAQVAEHSSEKAGVGSANLPHGTQCPKKGTKCGSSSAVECFLAKEEIAGANPVSRSINAPKRGILI